MMEKLAIPQIVVIEFDGPDCGPKCPRLYAGYRDHCDMFGIFLDRVGGDLIRCAECLEEEAKIKALTYKK